MKLGFALKKTKKSALPEAAGVASAFDAAPAKKADAVERVYVTDFDPAAVAPSSEDGKKSSTLVIPLLKTNEWKAQALAADIEGEASEAQVKAEGETTAEESPDAALTEDEIAARQLLAEAKALQNGDGSENARKANSSLVIPIKNRGDEDEAVAEKRAKLFNLDADKKNANGPTSVPILQQNAVPGLDELADVTEKYRHDVSLRPDELDVHSEVYESVPVEDFGAAMLRGMGWKGTVDKDEDADDPKPRQKLLGLGATAKPKLPSDTGKNGHGSRSRRNDDKPRSNGLNQRDDGSKRDNGNSSSSADKQDKRRHDERREGRARDKESSRARSRSRDRERSHRSNRNDDSRRKDRDRERAREKDRSKSRERDRKTERDRRDDRGRDRDRRDDRDRENRKRSRSRDRSSDRKKSSRR